MNKEKDQSAGNQQPVSAPKEETKQRSSAFNEPKPDAQKSTSNNEESDLEQERKQVSTERD